MSMVTDLDSWLTALGSTVGLPVTRDPALVRPPCLFASAPDVAAFTLPTINVELPLWLVGTGIGKPALDELLTHLPAVLTATGVKAAEFSELVIGTASYHGYRIPVRLNVTPE